MAKRPEVKMTEQEWITANQYELQRADEKYVKIGYDPTEGVIRMSVIAITPEKAAEFSRALIRFAEERVDKLAAPVRNDQLTGATANYDNAEQAVLDAANKVLELQI